MEYKIKTNNETECTNTMSRIKSYYTDDEINLNLYTSGSDYMLMDGTEYKGLYHEYIVTEEVYTLPAWDNIKSQKLIQYEIPNPIKIEYQKLNPDIKTEYQTIQPHKTEASIANRKNGFLTRYFIQKVNSLLIIEINKQQFDDYNSKKIDPNMYRVTQLKWVIVGNLSDSFNGNIYIPSVQTQNKQAISGVKKTIPGIAKFLTNLIEYYSDIDFLVPADINPKTTGFSKYSSNV